MEKKLYNRVREFRKENGLTQQELGNFVNVSRQTIISIEKGNYTPSVFLALKISFLLKKPVEELFYLK